MQEKQEKIHERIGGASKDVWEQLIGTATHRHTETGTNKHIRERRASDRSINLMEDRGRTRTRRTRARKNKDDPPFKKYRQEGLKRRKELEETNLQKTNPDLRLKMM